MSAYTAGVGSLPIPRPSGNGGHDDLSEEMQSAARN